MEFLEECEDLRKRRKELNRWASVLLCVRFVAVCAIALSVYAIWIVHFKPSDLDPASTLEDRYQQCMTDGGRWRSPFWSTDAACRQKLGMPIDWESYRYKGGQK